MQQLRLSGTGGQGLILAGIILAEAALLDGKNAIQSQSYGPEARGGSSKSEVLISGSVIHYPKITVPDVVLAMSQEACKKYTSDLQEDGILITDSQFVEKLLEKKYKKIYELPITHTAQAGLGKALFANIIALGAIAKITGVVSIESLTRAVLNRVPKGTEELNEKAIKLGMKLVK
ncbi:2-oxoacid:acceptor oxidoreductase family protein [Sporomusa acidovorans]|uniref:NADH-dependent phenylglyoxylate dehydrogenase subunit gamma n=1 Tax=Sporomusa acidovorans (strain ATCC 49682 / DSM 3132 / Mol) TaxID=1123286 RepID=A0ABZ3J5N0_SPOA4|nr:2-oxoacid:acceptor oxidoreductase family protein [Sporomusa acidovorans]OZC19696.1 NADH-dependent phenylglyoxylate dehydrogenase subunit gamma [Sporomusa acidovorans DSM 3132]SDF72188.1 2-oxoglutarate ferredoxin oxidoreductase subunit gamma [Sporomusa acidovorans]